LSAIAAAVFAAPKKMSTFVLVTFVLAVAAFKLIADITPAAVSAAFAGATEVKPPNARAATATADTFFNEIVFTIFLSFSRFQAFPGLGWWSKRPPH
jgi:hypothetical protein